MEEKIIIFLQDTKREMISFEECMQLFSKTNNDTLKFIGEQKYFKNLSKKYKRVNNKIVTFFCIR